MPVASGTWSREIVEKTAYMPGLGQYDHASDTAVYFVTDIVGTTQSISHGGGPSVRHGLRIVQTAFGERVHADGIVGTRYQFAGAFGYETFPAWDDDAVIDAAGAYATDEDMPFVHVGYRYYCPETGRFLQSDPIGIRGGLNTYVYCGSNPVRSVDPYGLETQINLTPEQVAELIQTDINQGGAVEVELRRPSQTLTVEKIECTPAPGGRKVITITDDQGNTHSRSYPHNQRFDVTPPASCTDPYIVDSCGVTGIEAAPVMLLVLRRLRRRRRKHAV